MKFPKITVVCLLAVVSGLFLRADENSAVKVEASRALSLAIVDLDRKNPCTKPSRTA
jgi:hypothetical protein